MIPKYKVGDILKYVGKDDDFLTNKIYKLSRVQAFDDWIDYGFEKVEEDQPRNGWSALFVEHPTNFIQVNITWRERFENE